MGWIIKILIAAVLLIILFLLNFYRDPKRMVPKGNNIVAPADGRVISILKTSKKDVRVNKGFLGKIRVLTKDIAKECHVISIFMSPLDVHINRAPIEGTIKSITHTKGKFFKAYDMGKSLENEKNEIIIEGRIKVKVIQTAGFLARRIKCYIKQNQKVNKGEKIGMIALSSQTTIIIPAGVDLMVKVKEKMKAGETIIGVLK